MNRIAKKLLLAFIIIGLFVFVLYLNSFKPRKINLTHDGIMFSKEAYLAKDYNNLDLQKITIKIDGHITKRWLRAAYFEGKIDIDNVMPNINYVMAITSFTDHYPSTIIYYQHEKQSSITHDFYANSYYDDYFDRIYLELLDITGYKGYSILAPAKDIDDIDSMWEFLKSKYPLFFND